MYPPNQPLASVEGNEVPEETGLPFAEPEDGFDEDGSVIIPELVPEEMGMVPAGQQGMVSPEQEMELAQEQEKIEAEEAEFQDKLKSALKNIIQEYEVRDQPVRERLLKFWRKANLFWDGIQNIIFDGLDYRSANDVLSEMGETADDFDPYYYDKIINVYRSYGESVIAALTQEVPPVIFPPDDAADVNDVRTSNAYNKISELIAKHNQAPIILLHAMYILWNQGLIAAYTYTHTDKKYGEYDVPEEQMVKRQVITGHYCPFCGQDFFESPDQDGNGFCDACDRMMQPVPETTEMEVPKIVGYNKAPKSRECIKVYGPDQVFVPHYVKEQDHIPVVVLKTDIHYTLAQEMYPDIAEKIGPSIDDEPYGRWSRSFPEGYGDDDQDLTTIRQCWARPWVFNKLLRTDPDFVHQVRARYPKGVEFSIVNTEVDKIADEDLDESWTFSVNPLSSHLHAKPLGAPLIPIQEIRNELVLLKLQTVEYGIPETFAEASAINWPAYRQNPARPGMMYPANAKPGQTLDGSFTTLKTATFPPESIEFQNELDQDAQFVVGAFPSIYGGASTDGGKTAAEYGMRRSQALQRLSIHWKFVSWWWANTMSKSVRHFHQNLLKTGEDARYSVKTGSTWESIWIRREHLMGKVGQVEPELADTFPMSWSQRRDLLLQLLAMKDENVNAALFNSENTSMLAQYLGFPNMYIPGQDDRSKQLQEIYLLTQPGAEPLDLEGTYPSIPVDPEIDNHEVEYNTCTTWMKGDAGLDAKINNPAGYANVRAHATWHLTILMERQAAEAEAEAQSKSKESNGDNGGEQGAAAGGE